MKTEQFIKSFDGTRIYTESTGSGIPILLCDGLGCDGFIWKFLRPLFEDRYQLIHFHYRGHGLSDAPAARGALEVTHLREDVIAVMDHYEIDRAILLGHSMGVQVILDYALYHPERVAGLVPICGSYGRPLDTFHNTDLGARLLPYIRKVVGMAPVKAQLAWSQLLMTELAYQIAVNLEVNGRVLERSHFGPYFEHLASMDCRVFLDLVDGLMNHSTENLLPELKVPTLVVGGDRDTFTPPRLSYRMHELIEDSELLMIPGGTHIATIEIPELFHLRLDSFLQQRVVPLIKPPKRTARRGTKRPVKLPASTRATDSVSAGASSKTKGKAKGRKKSAPKATSPEA